MHARVAFPAVPGDHLRRHVTHVSALNTGFSAEPPKVAHKRGQVIADAIRIVPARADRQRLDVITDDHQHGCAVIASLARDEGFLCCGVDHGGELQDCVQRVIARVPSVRAIRARWRFETRARRRPQRSGEDNLGNVVHRPRDRNIKLEPELSHAS